MLQSNAYAFSVGFYLYLIDRRLAMPQKTIQSDSPRLFIVHFPNSDYLTNNRTTQLKLIKMKKLNIIMAILAAALFTSCAGLHSLTQTSIANSPNVEISQNNFHVVKQVSSSATTTYIFGVGGLSQKALRQNAVADMITKANLTGSQTVINITTKISRRIITPFYIRSTATAYGTVVEFDNPSFGYTVSLTEVDKEKVSNNITYGASATSPLGLCQTGDIKDLSAKEQKAVLGMLADELSNDMRNARTTDDLKAVQKNVELLRTYYGLMNKGTQKNVDKLNENLKKRISRFEKMASQK